MRLSRALAVAAAAAALAGAGCGGDDEDQDARTAPPDRTQTTGTVERTDTAPSAPRRTETEGESPEDQPGGAGDEAPARSQALFTGRAGRITPRLVRVPPFISIRVELRSADGGAYGLRFGSRTVRAGGPVGASSLPLPGLRPGRRVVGRPVGRGSRVVIEASAEPGP
jgi:hypothetical protein